MLTSRISHPWLVVSLILTLCLSAGLAPQQAVAQKKKNKADSTKTAIDSTKVTDKKKKKFSLKKTITGLFKGKDEEPKAAAPVPAGGGNKSDAAKSKAEQSSGINHAKADSVLDYYASGYERSLESGDYQMALKYLQLYQQAQDSILTLQIAADSARVAQEKAELQAKAAQESEARQKIVSISTGIVLVMVIGLAISLFVAFRNKKRHNEQLKVFNQQLSEANAEIKAQADLLADQHEHIMDSINYARRIQEAILPNLANITRAFPQSFVLYLPKEIVSGDFFWFHSVPGGGHLVAAVDCTGHGVPGAFMSVLGMSLLQQIMAEDPTLPPDQILNRLHQGVIQSLRQTEAGVNQQDGMDIALLKILPGNRKAQFAGAHNPLYLIRKGELEIYMADKAPIGGRRYVDHKFGLTEIDLEPGDTLYVFSDGYADQFGGDKQRKFSYKQLRQTLLTVEPKTLPQQAEVLKTTHLTWRGKNEQLDDILIIGVRV